MDACAITRWRGVCPPAPTRPTCAMRLLRPDGLTRPTWLTRMRMMSAWRNHGVSIHSWYAMSAPSQLTRQHSRPTCHVIGREPSCELRYRIQCNWSYVQPDLRLNLGCSSGQNCVDQILVVWNVIWTISDLFSANLIVSDAMVWFDRWDWDRKWW